jgi:hypothetical protein
LEVSHPQIPEAPDLCNPRKYVPLPSAIEAKEALYAYSGVFAIESPVLAPPALPRFTLATRDPTVPPDAE